MAIDKTITVGHATTTDGTWYPGWQPYLTPQYVPMAAVAGDDYVNELEVEQREHDVTVTFRRDGRVVKRLTMPRGLWEARS